MTFTHHRILRLLAFTLPVAVFAACGSDSNNSGGTDGGTNNNPDATTGGEDATVADTGDNMPPSCDPNFGAAPGCGNDMTGSWTYRSACGSTAIEDGVRQACAQATFEATSHVVTGTLDVTAGGYMLNSTDQAVINAMIPAACAAPLGGCMGVQTAINTQLNQPTTCTQAGADCRCTTNATIGAQEMGTLNTNAGTVTTMPSTGGMGTYYYCVEGNVLRYRQMGEGTVFVLTK